MILPEKSRFTDRHELFLVLLGQLEGEKITCLINNICLRLWFLNNLMLKFMHSVQKVRFYLSEHVF